MYMECCPIVSWQLLNQTLPAICIVLLFLYLLLDQHFTQKNNPIPSFPILRILPSIILNLNRLSEWLTDMLAKSGGTFHASGPVLCNMEYVITCDPNNIEYILKTNFQNFPKGPEFQDIFDDVMMDGVFTADGDSWKRQRRIANTHFQSKNFRAFNAKTTIGLIQERLLPLLQHFSRSGLTLDLQDVLVRFSTDSTCKVVFGTDLRCLSLNFPVHSFTRAIDTLGEVLIYRHAVPTWWWHLLRRLNLGMERKTAISSKTLVDFVEDLIAQKKKNLNQLHQEDIISRYLVEFFDDETFVRISAVNFFLAGRDTVAYALTWFFWLTSTHPRVERKILEELHKIKSQKKRQFGFEADDIADMVYLHAAAYEALRLYPTVALGHRGVAKEDRLPDGHVVKPGDKLLYSPYAVARMEWVWGKDCREFRPERWIDEEGKVKHEANSTKFIPFSVGPRTCLGKELSIMHMKFVAAGVLLNYEIEVVKGHKAIPIPSVIFQMRGGLPVKVKERASVRVKLVAQ